MELAPTAVQDDAVIQETSARTAPAEDGRRCPVQAEPFHATAHGHSPPVVVPWVPTAIQSDAEVHDTPVRSWSANVVVAIVCSLQLTPFHCPLTAVE